MNVNKIPDFRQTDIRNKGIIHFENIHKYVNMFLCELQ